MPLRIYFSVKSINEIGEQKKKETSTHHLFGRRISPTVVWEYFFKITKNLEQILMR